MVLYDETIPRGNVALSKAGTTDGQVVHQRRLSSYTTRISASMTVVTTATVPLKTVEAAVSSGRFAPAIGEDVCFRLFLSDLSRSYCCSRYDHD